MTVGRCYLHELNRRRRQRLVAPVWTALGGAGAFLFIWVALVVIL